MVEHIETDICVIGAGSAGLSVAAGASQMGAPTVLIEGHKMGGDCLNYGCVPSKALLAAGKLARHADDGAAFGVALQRPQIDFRRVHDHVQDVIGAIAPHDSVERFEGLGVRVIQAKARFTGPREVAAGDAVIRARRFVVATGSSPAVPPIPGLSDVPYLTNETVFDRTEAPAHLIVIGGGPIGLELAQAHRHLGAEVTVLELATVLAKDDPELADIVRRQVQGDGVVLREGIKIARVERVGDGVAVILAGMDGAEERVAGSHLLVATGRKANVADLDLDKAGIKHSPKGIEVDARLRTSNRHVFAMGDVAGGYQFTHVAGYHAGIVIRNALFRLPAKVDYRAVPWVTFTAPELANVGLTEAEAQTRHGEIRVLRWSFHENDRAQAERATDGMIKVVVKPNGLILGAGIVGAQAGELIQLWGLAIQQGLKIGAIAGMIAPYPTLGEISKRAAGSFYTSSLFSERTRKLVRFLARFG
jgi:pyruvate/2-oxoglutarate dehydrogenase complex dihydrolipoamide dehydrogenase (E3) component